MSARCGVWSVEPTNAVVVARNGMISATSHFPLDDYVAIMIEIFILTILGVSYVVLYLVDTGHEPTRTLCCSSSNFELAS